jgi:deoxyribodipyrimidine photo-lyase
MTRRPTGPDPEPTREAGLARLKEFVPKAGQAYQRSRHYDWGPERRENVSGLSAYLSTRLVTEAEVAAAVLDHHKPQDAEAFLDEICRRTYWRGWLEGRPQVLSAWQRLRVEDSRRWPQREDFQSAVAGRTGITAFDAWVGELKDTGYLHHQARLAFSSIWIFTLKLPWSLGAEFFLTHLLDGDVATNTLNWRSVAGLQTKGQHHVASAEDIERFSQGRFQIGQGLAQAPKGLSGPPIPPYVPPIPYPLRTSDQLGDDYAVLVTGDDLYPEGGVIGDLKPKLVLTLNSTELAIGYQPRVLYFKSRAMRDAQTRAEAHFQCPSLALTLGQDPPSALSKVMKERSLTGLVYNEPFLGPWKELTNSVVSRDVGIKFFPLRRPWDSLLHAHAAKGYVHFRKQALPQIVRVKGSFGIPKVSP